MKITNSQMPSITMEETTNDYTFRIVWEGAGATREVECIKRPSNLNDQTITEAQIKALVSALREAKTKFNDELDKMEELLKPFIEYISSKNTDE